MNLNYYIARKIYGNDGGEKKQVSLPAIRVATIGVAIGLAVMILTVCVVLGFKHSIEDKVSSIGGDIQVTSFKSYQMGENIPIEITDSILGLIRQVPNIKDIQLYSDVQGILKTDSDFLGIVFRGAAYPAVAQEQELTIPQQQNTITISRSITDKLCLNDSDKIFAYFINESVRARKFTIDSIYQTNMSMYDKSLCFINFNTVNKLNNWDEGQCSGLHITVLDRKAVNETAQLINSRLRELTDSYGEQYCTRTIQEVQPGIFAWLELLDVNVWIILALMVCVAGITMISGLLIIILERTQMIGLLKALGARNMSVRHTFLWFAAFIIGRGLIWGNIIGLGIALLQRHTGIISLDANNYYVDTVPVEINLPYILLLNVATMLICILVLVIPSHLISHISPSRSMRYE